MVHHLDAERLELPCVSDTGQLKHLWRVDRAAAEDHLCRPNGPHSPPLDDLNAPSLRALEQDPVHERTAANLEVGAIGYRMQVRAGRAQPPAAMNRAVERAESFLPVAVH